MQLRQGMGLALLLASVLLAPGLTDPVLVNVEGEPLPQPVAVAQASPPAASDSAPRRWLGVTLDLGVPDGVTAAVVFAPGWLRLGLGVMTHGGGVGVRLSIALVPFDTALRPVAAVDVGHYFEGDLSWVVADSGSPAHAALKGLQYDFASAHLGVELGSRSVAVRLEGGVTWVHGSLGPVEQSFGGTKVSVGRATLAAVAPSGKLGLTWLFL